MKPGAIGAARLGALALGLFLSILPLALGEAWARELGDASRLAMAATPWVVIAGWPGARGSVRDWPFALGLVLPVWALCAWFDLRLGLGLGRLQATFAAAVVMVACLGEARAQAVRGALAIYGPLWLLVVGILPALAVAAAWGQGQRLTDEGLPGALAAFAPVASIWRDVQPMEGDLARQGIESALFCPSTLVCVALVMICTLLNRRSSP